MKNRNNQTILALGADIKSRFCVLKNNSLILSGDFGNLADLDNFSKFRKSILRLKINPDRIAFDMHPGYFSSRLSDSLEAKKKISVQHHHAHIASVLSADKINKPVIGVAFDGTGYGIDGNVWGGEFMVVDKDKFKRLAHFKYLSMPGAELAIRQPWRMAFSIVYDCIGDKILNQRMEFLKLHPKSYQQVLIKMIKNNINLPKTSSVGRLFDAVSSILGICHQVNFEAEAAIKLEKLASQSKDRYSYGFDIFKEGDIYIIGYNKLIGNLLSDIKKGVSKSDIAKRFHNSLADLTIKIIDKIAQKYCLNDIVLSGGVFSNKILFDAMRKKLADCGYNLIYNKDVPFGDSSICLGQAYVALNSK